MLPVGVHEEIQVLLVSLLEKLQKLPLPVSTPAALSEPAWHTKEGPCSAPGSELPQQQETADIPKQ